MDYFDVGMNFKSKHIVLLLIELVELFHFNFTMKEISSVNLLA